MEQLITPNYNIGYTGGKCERYSENTTGQSGVWGAAVHPIPSQQIYTGAWDSNYGNGNHPGELPPVGFSVPVYFELGSTPAGHVAIILPDGRVASSSQEGYHSTPYIYPNLNALIADYAKYNNGCTYLGWSEYIGKIQVVSGEEIMNDPQDIRNLGGELWGRAVDEPTVANLTGKSWHDVMYYLVSAWPWTDRVAAEHNNAVQVETDKTTIEDLQTQLAEASEHTPPPDTTDGSTPGTVPTPPDDSTTAPTPDPVITPPVPDPVPTPVEKPTGWAMFVQAVKNIIESLFGKKK